MNCEQTNFLLDTGSPEKLAHGDRQALDRHLASCRACRETWAAYREIAALPIPNMPRQLRARVAAAVAGRSSAEPRRTRGWIGVGSLLVVGAAAAATAVVQLVERAPESREAVELRAPEVTPAPPTPTPAAAPAARVEPGGNVDGPDEPAGAAVGAAPFALDAHSIVVLPVAQAGIDARAATDVAGCHEEVLRQLRAVDGLNVIAGQVVSAFAASGLAEEEIARELGAGSVLVLRTRPGFCSARQLDARTGAELGVPTVSFVEPEFPPDGWRTFAARVAQSVENATLKDPSTVIVEAHAKVLNTALDDEMRLSALFDLLQETISTRAALDAGVVAAAVQLATSSRSAEVRERAWVALRGVDDTYVIQRLLHSLANDPAEAVRREAALALGYFVDAPGVHDALTRAAANDPSAEVAGACCTPTAREAARYALLSAEERRALALRTLLDESLPAEQRLRPFDSSLDGRDPPRVDETAARAIFDVGARTEDSIARSMAWHLLVAVGDLGFKPVLLEDLARHPAANVRLAAARALAQHRDDPAVRTALEQARSDSSRDVQRAAREALGER
jgi:HEAT repeat protein